MHLITNKWETNDLQAIKCFYLYVIIHFLNNIQENVLFMIKIVNIFSAIS